MCSYTLRLYRRETFSTMMHDPGVAGLKHFVGSPLHDLTWRSTIHIWLVCFFLKSLCGSTTNSKKNYPSSKNDKASCTYNLPVIFLSSHCGGTTRGARVTFSRCWQQTLPASWCGIPGWEEIFGDFFVCQGKTEVYCYFLSFWSMEKGNMSQINNWP